LVQYFFVSAERGYEVFVNPPVDPEVGEIVIVKKKKSCAALDGMAWGALGETTNISKMTQTGASQPVTKPSAACRPRPNAVEHWPREEEFER
jgi:hypothetical protein